MEYDYVTNYGVTDGFGSVDNGQMASVMAMLGTYSIVILIVGILMIVELWIIYKKCGKPGWASIVPIYNIWVLFTICDLPGWLSLIPVANGIGMLICYFKLPKKLGKSATFGIGCLFLPVIFFGILAFSKNKEKQNESVVEEPEMPAEVPSMNETPAPQAAASTPDLMSAPEVPNLDQNASANSPMPEVTEAAPDLMASNTMPNNNGPINEVVPEKQFINEEPALNTSEPEMPAPAMPIAPEPAPEPTPVVEENIINAFDMPAPATDNVQINDLNPSPAVDNVNSNPVVESLDTVMPNVAPTPDTIDVPQMTNEAINSDITVTKKCPNCGTENPYINKVCSNCGTALE